MKRGAQVTLAVAVGYLLGRRRKMRWALALGTAAATGRLSGGPGELLGRAAKALGSSGELSKVAGLGGPLVTAGKAAARTAVRTRIDSISDGLHERAEALRRPASPDADDEEAERPRRRARAVPAEEPDEDEFDDEAYDEERTEPEPPRRRRRPRERDDELPDDELPEDEKPDDEERGAQRAARSRPATGAPVRRRKR